MRWKTQGAPPPATHWKENSDITTGRYPSPPYLAGQYVSRKSRGRWADRLVQSRGAFWITFAATPVLGPWLVMALMRWVGVPQRRIALALVCSMVTLATVVATLCAFVPAVFA